MSSSTPKSCSLQDVWSQISGCETSKTVAQDCKISLPWNVDTEDLVNFAPFARWSEKLAHNLALQENEVHAFHSRPYALRGIEIQVADWFGQIDQKTGKSKKLGFLKMQVKIETEKDSQGNAEAIPGSVFLRGLAVGVLVSCYIV